MTTDEKYLRLKIAVEKLVAVKLDEVLPKDPRILLAIGVLCPNLDDFLLKVGDIVMTYSDLEENKERN